MPDLSNIIKLFVSDDIMEARIYISSAPDATGISHVNEITSEDLLQFLHENGVKAGINEGNLKGIITEKLFDRYHTIANGKNSVQGKAGFYTFFFKTEIDSKPVVLEDGSVDYHATTNYEQVTEGMLLAEYTPATAGFSGYDVHGKILMPVPGKELVPLKGEGFTVKDNQYFSSVNGKVELKGDTLIVSNVLNIKGDVDLTTGDIIFNGDVIVEGNVLSGSMIQATGNLTVVGNVEGATISADGDIVLKSGMQGGGKGTITCGCDLWGKFFEHTKLIVRKDLHANSLLNCESVCDNDIFIHGRHGIIVGGTTKCRGNINATVIGNMSEVKTDICAGINDTTLSEIQILEDDIKEIEAQLAKHSVVNEKLSQITNPTDVEKYTSMVNQVRASMDELNGRLAQRKNILEQKLFLVESSSHSIIVVGKYMYPGVNILLNGLHYTSKETFTNITIKAAAGKIQLVSNV